MQDRDATEAESDPASVSRQTCKAFNKRNERCRKSVVTDDGYCLVHSPDPERRQSMKALGRKGGSQPKLGKSAGGDLRETLREQIGVRRLVR